MPDRPISADSAFTGTGSVLIPVVDLTEATPANRNKHMVSSPLTGAPGTVPFANGDGTTAFRAILATDVSGLEAEVAEQVSAVTGLGNTVTLFPDRLVSNNGAARATATVGSAALDHIGFDASVAESVQALFAAPATWDKNGLIVEVIDSAAATGNVLWEASARGAPAGTPVGAPLGTARSAAQTISAADAEAAFTLPAVEIGGGIGPNRLVRLQLRRLAADAADTLTTDARVALIRVVNSDPPPPPVTIPYLVFFDASVLSSMRQDRTGAGATIPAAVDQPVGSIQNLGTAGGWITAPSDTARPILRNAGSVWWLEGSTNRMFLDASGTLLRNVAGFTIFQGIRITTGGATHRIHRVNGASAPRVELIVNTSNQYRANIRRNDADTAIAALSSALTVGADVSLITRGNYTTLSFQNFVNGTVNGNVSGLTAGSTPNDGGGYEAMAATGPLNGLQGRFYAWGVHDAALSDADIATLHSLLNTRMGL